MSCPFMCPALVCASKLGPLVCYGMHVVLYALPFQKCPALVYATELGPLVLKIVGSVHVDCMPCAFICPALVYATEMGP